MKEIAVTLTGHVATQPVLRATTGGHLVCSFRVASTSRRYDKAEGAWRDGDTVFSSVTCWRELAENVTQSLSVGDAVIVQGTLSTREYQTGTGETRSSLEVAATAVGPDLSRGVAKLARTVRVARAAERENPEDPAADGDAGAVDTVEPLAAAG